MKIGKFKLDHRIEKNNECIIFRGSSDQEKYMIIQMNRQPLISVELFRQHFQKELQFLFKQTSKPQVVPSDFPFVIPDSEFLQSDLIEFPKIIEIHQTDTHYYFICENFLQGQITNQQIDHPKIFLQIYNLFDVYYQEFKENRIADRDFSIMRIFRSEDKLTLIDFGFASLQKQLPKKSWVVKLGELFNVLAKNDSRIKVKNVINTLMIGKIKWDQVQDLLNVSFGYDDIDRSLEDNFNDKNSRVSRQNSIYSKQQTQTLSMVPQEIIITDQQNLQKSPYQESIKSKPRQSILTQSKIIQYGNEKQREHFQKIKQSLSPGFTHTTRMPCRLLPIDTSMQETTPQIRSVSRKNYNQGQFTRQPITQPINNSFEYRGRTTPRQDTQQYYQQFDKQEFKRDNIYQDDLQRKINSLTTNNSQFEPSSNTQTIYQRGQSLNDRQEVVDFPVVKRPQSGRPEEQKKELKTLLRTSTRELQKPDLIKQKASQETAVNRTINYSETLSNNQYQEFQQKPFSRRNSVRKQSNHSIESIELQTTKNQVIVQQIQDQFQNKPIFKTPKDRNNTTTSQIQQPFMNNQDFCDHRSEQNRQQNKVSEFQQKENVQNLRKDQDRNQNYQQQQNANNKQNFQDEKKKSQNSDSENNNQEEQYVPSFYQNKNKTTVKNNFMQKPAQNIIEQQKKEEKHYEQAQTLDEYYKQPTVQKQNSIKRPPTPQKKQEIINDEDFKQITIVQDTKNINQSFNQIESQNQSFDNQQKKPNTPKSVRKINISTTQVEKIEIKEIVFKITQEEENYIAMIYENQIKKYDVIGRMVGGNVKYFQALKNFWIVPMFLCYKRMVTFRKMFEDGLNQRINFFNLDMAKVDQVEKIKIIQKKLFSENQIVLQELQSLFTQCEKQSQKFEAKELAKIQKFLNLDLNQDIKDIYFVYLYTQVFKTLQTQKIKYEQDPIKLKENLQLQCSTLVSLIVSELPFNNDKKILDLDEFERLLNDKNFNREQIEKYINQKEETVQNLKQRLNSKGIKI